MLFFRLVGKSSSDRCRLLWLGYCFVECLDSLLSASSYGFAVLLLASLLFEIVEAEYDCSAQDDGWYFDPEFCHIYWRCIHGTSEEFECASGTAWDHHENRCNWLDSVDCTRAEKTTEKIVTEEEEEDEEEEAEEEEEQTVTEKTSSKKKTKKAESNRRMLDDDGDDRQISIGIFL